MAADVDLDDVVTHSVLTDPSQLFEVDQETGDVSLRAGAGLDYETAAQHTLTVRATDAAGLSADAEITIQLLDRETIARSVAHVFAMRGRSMRGNEPTDSWPYYDDMAASCSSSLRAAGR